MHASYIRKYKLAMVKLRKKSRKKGGIGERGQ